MACFACFCGTSLYATRANASHSFAEDSPCYLPANRWLARSGFLVAKQHGMNREWKGHMRRRFDRRLWTLILSLLLVGGASLTSPTFVRADLASGESQPAAPPPDGGDPDWPQGPQGKSPKPAPTRGAGSSAGDSYRARNIRIQWVKWALRVAYVSTYRIFFRY